ncbi:MAG: P-II family nitrogen regulator [Bacilli bacterium]
MYNFELILTICNHGFAEAVMETAKQNGARGGTILHARGSAMGEVSKFFGISIHPEKDILMIVTQTTTKAAIMKGIVEAHGVKTPAHGICFSVPVEDAIGFNF